jgi:DNA-directed RNA polymerase specialized sigma24 family protein
MPRLWSQNAWATQLPTSLIMTCDEYGQMYQQGFLRTVRLLQGRGASMTCAEDLAQTAWMQGWRKLDQLRDRSLLTGWINTIAVNFQRREGAREARYEELSGLEACHLVDSVSDRLDVAKVLNTCRPLDRKLFEQQLDGLTIHEIADQLGVSATATRIRFLRARRATRRRLDGRPVGRPCLQGSIGR